MANAISVVQLWIICVISQNWRPDVRCGDVMTRMLKSTWCAAGASFQEWSIALVGMPEVWPCDAASRSLGEPGLHTELDVCLDRMAAPILPRREEPDINTLCPQSTFQELPVMGKEYASFRSLVTTSPRIWCETRAWRELSELQSCDWAVQLA